MNPTLQLSPAEMQSLRQLAHRTGKTEEELVREAVAQLLGEASPTAWQQAVQAAQGLWQERTDLPDFVALRAEGERGAAN